MQLSFLRLGRAGAVADATASGLSPLSSTTTLQCLEFVVIVLPTGFRLAQVLEYFAGLVRPLRGWLYTASRFREEPLQLLHGIKRPP